MVINEKNLSADFVVVGGGVAGLCAAVAAARNGAKTIIVQDRSMFGGNASSEIRMWICGAHGENRKETGLLEELQLNNIFYNPGLKYTLWDDVMYSFALAEKNLTIILNTTVESVEVENNKITSVTGWNLVEYTRYHLSAPLFADCSGDGILRLSGAKYMRGREAKSEFNESLGRDVADLKTMGNSILIQLRKTDKHYPFRAPEWAYHYTEETVPKRAMQPAGDNFWWMEFGGVKDTIADAEEIRNELYKIAYGTWEYMKNHPDKRGHEWELDWMGSLPGKRENVRFTGDHVLNQNDVDSEGKFEDTVCYGGWTMDDHHPEAIYYPGEPTIFHPAPSPFGIPYRALYSVNIDNLLFAGRQISATHMAMSATRVMATTSTMGQAVGTAAALCTKYQTSPRDIYNSYLEELQQTLLDQDQFLPNIPRKLSALTLEALASHEILRDTWDRDWEGEEHGITLSVEESCGYTFAQPTMVSGLRIVFDSDLAYPKKQLGVEDSKVYLDMPPILTRNFRVEVRSGENWQTIANVTDNRHRLVKLAWTPQAISEIRLIPEKGWGEGKVRIFSMDVL